MRAVHVRTEARVQMTSTLTPVTVPLDTRVSTVMKVSVSSVKSGHFGCMRDIALKQLFSLFKIVFHWHSSDLSILIVLT